MIKWLEKIIQKLFWSDRGFHESLLRAKMTMCILMICGIVGGIAQIIVTKEANPLLISCIALNVAVLLVLCRKELKKLWDKLTGNDKFDGGNFS